MCSASLPSWFSFRLSGGCLGFHYYVGGTYSGGQASGHECSASESHPLIFEASLERGFWASRRAQSSDAGMGWPLIKIKWLMAADQSF